jgi:hypothetical protein
MSVGPDTVFISRLRPRVASSQLKIEMVMATSTVDVVSSYAHTLNAEGRTNDKGSKKESSESNPMNRINRLSFLFASNQILD